SPRQFSYLHHDHLLVSSFGCRSLPTVQVDHPSAVTPLDLPFPARFCFLSLSSQSNQFFKHPSASTLLVPPTHPPDNSNTFFTLLLRNHQIRSNTSTGSISS
ncbi:hypothetical protein QWA68_002353, partial [Fusarium oxysporum]